MAKIILSLEMFFAKTPRIKIVGIVKIHISTHLGITHLNLLSGSSFLGS
jgi:hypothetical protein